jgi:hypothetical protein
MGNLIAAVLFAASQVGTIQVFVDPGFEVFLDSHSMGVSAGQGLQINDVAPGEHVVTVKTSWGTSLGQRVTVVAGQISKVPVASLGLRTRPRGDDSTVVVQVLKTTAVVCDLAMGSQKISKKPSELQFDKVPSGPYRVALTCGGRSATTDITLAPGRLITLQADLATGRMTVTSDESRITQMKVRGPAEVIMAMDLPIAWRRALAGAVVPGITVSTISQLSDRKAKVVLKTIDLASIQGFAVSLSSSPEVVEVNSDYDYQYRYQATRDGYELSLIVTFRP